MPATVISHGVLLTGLGVGNALTIATLGDGYAYDGPPPVGVGVYGPVLGIGEDSSGNRVILKLGSVGELLS